MESKLPLLTIRVFVLVTALSCGRGLDVSIPFGTYNVVRGDNVNLTCKFVPARPSNPLIVVKWEAEADSPEKPMMDIATYYSTGDVDIAPAYEGKAFLSTDVVKQESILILTKVTLKENRTFHCNVLIPKDDEGTTSATTSLVVLVPPSIPICKVQGTAEYWNNINLTCLSEEGSPKPSYSWQSHDVKNTLRPLPPKTTERNGILSLFNISMETSGFYICTSANKIRSASCNFTLTVMPPSMNIGSTAGIIGGVIAGILILGIIIYCCCKKKSKHEPYAQGPPDAVFRDKSTVEVGEGYRDSLTNIQTKPSNERLDQLDVKGEDDQSHPLSPTDDHSCYDSRKQSPEYHDEDSEKQPISYGASRDHLDNNRGHNGSRDQLDNGRGRYVSSQERLDDIRPNARIQDRLENIYVDIRDRLDDSRRLPVGRDRLDDSYRHGGSRDRLDDSYRYGGSRDRLDDSNRYGGSRDHLDNSNRHKGSRDRLDDSNRFGGSRDRLDDSNRYGGSRDRLDDSNRYGGSRDRLDDIRQHRGSRDDLNDNNRYEGSRDRLDDSRRYGGSRDHLDNSR